MRRTLFSSAAITVAFVASAAAQQPPARGVRELTASLRDGDPAVRAQAACSLRANRGIAVRAATR